MHCFIMEIPNKQEIQQVASNHSSDIEFKNFMNLCKKCTAKPYFISVNDTTLLSDNPLHFRKNLSDRTPKIIMKINNKIRDEKLQYNINKETSKILVLSSGKIDIYEYVIGKEVLSPGPSQIIEPATFTYSPLEYSHNHQFFLL